MTYLNKNDGDLDLFDIISILWSKKVFIASITAFFAISSIVISLSLPNIYKSEALLMPQEQTNNMGGMLGQYSGMASLAGISIPTETSTKSQEAISRIRSFEFFSKHFLPKINFVDLVAVKRWNSDSNEIIYNKKIYNPDTGKWVGKTKTEQEAYKSYIKSLSVIEDKKTSFVILSTKHKSPYIAQQWTNIIIDEIHSSMREQDKEEATKSIEFLNGILSSKTVQYDEVRKALSSLQQEQMKQLMMIEANEDYIFSVLDSPIVPELKSEPSRSIIVILVTFLGFIISVIYSLINFYSKARNKI